MQLNRTRFWNILGRVALIAGAVWLCVIVLVLGGAVWLAYTHPKQHPLDMARALPLLQRAAGVYGVKLDVGGMHLYYDGSPVVRVEDVRLSDPDGELAVLVEEGKVRVAKGALFVGRIAPKDIEASGVTLRIVQKSRKLRVAGFDVASDPNAPQVSLVKVLNDLAGNVFLGRLKNVVVDRLTLLLRDEDRATEWVLEDGHLVLSRYRGTGEQGDMSAVLRRLYGGGALESPVRVIFSHEAGASTADIRARFDRMDAGVVADYLPPQFADIFRARGQVELSTTLRL